MSAPSSRIFRVKFRQWRTYAMDVAADTVEEAIAYGQLVLKDFGTADFDEIISGTDDWDAEPDDPDEDVLPNLHKALTALNAAPRFQVGDTDSYVIAAELARTIRKLETGGAQ